MQKQFLELYDEYYPKLYAYILLRVRRREIAEDIVQQSFLKALDNLASFKPRRRATFGSWLFRIAKNELIDHLRQSHKITFCETSLIDAAQAPTMILEELLTAELETEQKERWQKVLCAIDNLNDEERELITLKYLADLPYKEIAQTMQKKPNTLAVMLKRALEKVRSDIGL